MDRTYGAAGYEFLIRELAIEVVPNWHETYVSEGNLRHTRESGDRVRDTYPSPYWPGDGIGEQLEFALKYDGTNPQILSAVFRALSAKQLVQFSKYVGGKRLGKYRRRLWYWFELSTGQTLSLQSLDRGPYVALLDDGEQYTAKPRRVQRQRLMDNRLGGDSFCPTVRRTATLTTFESAGLDLQATDLVASCPPDVLRRAMQYLYTKETKSSFAIEHEQPTADRTARFVALLHAAERDDFVHRSMLIGLQNQIVHPEYRESDYRTTQNYVGETVTFGRERMHYVSPRPQDVQSLMDGLVVAHRRMENGHVPPVVQAAVVAYAFVFIHPFEDGNGRAHRFLIHNVLARRGFTPPGLIFPVSAVMLENKAAYDGSLEAFSVPLMRLVEYTLDEQGRATVQNDTLPCYRFIDLTSQAEALYGFVKATIDTELTNEIRYLRHYDRAKRLVQTVADIPDRLIDLFIHCCAQNHGKLSTGKRKSLFGRLTDDEVDRMEQAIQRAQVEVTEEQG